MANDRETKRGADEGLSDRVRHDARRTRAHGDKRATAAKQPGRKRAKGSAGTGGEIQRLGGPGVRRSDRIIAFIELLTIPDGRDVGKPFILREWQKDIIRGIYDPETEDGKRRIRTALLTMARKNGKTSLIAALVLVHLVGPESNSRQQIYSAANDKEQAAVVYRAAEAMVLADPDLSALVTCVPSTKRLVCVWNGSFYRALSADAKTKHGLNPAVWIYDELAHAAKHDLYDTLASSQGAQEEPLGIIISTQARDPLSLMSELVEDARRVLDGRATDPTLAAFIFEVSPDADPFDESLWPLANPALDDFLSLADMRAAAAKAKRLPSQLSMFRNLRLNQQVDGVDHIIGAEEWKACGVPVDLAALKGQPCWGGLDLSSKRDLTALVLVFPSADGVMSVLVRCWTPAHKLGERGQIDRAPYPTWVEQGHLIAVPGKSIDYRYVALELARLAAEYDIRGIAYDDWNMHHLMRACVDEGVSAYVEGGDCDTSGIRMIRWRQGFKTMSPALEQTEMAVVDRRIAHGMHPLLTWAASNAVAVADAAGNRKIAKDKARNRIDPFVALTMAVGAASLAPQEKPEEGSIWDDLAKT